MKFVLCLLVLLPFVCCEEERFILDTFGLDHLSLNDVVGHLQAALGSDTSEAACEAACPSVLGVIPGGSLAAPLLCHPACVDVMRDSPVHVWVKIKLKGDNTFFHLRGGGYI